LSLIVAGYLILALSYSMVTPIGRGADEWAHYGYAQFIAQNGRLPLSAAEREAAGYKSDWPPLYHLLAAGLTGWIETAGPPTFKYRAENVHRQLIPAQGPEAILHTEDELFPWQQEILVWHVGRFLSILFSAGTVVATYFIAREVMNEFRIQNSEFRIQNYLHLISLAAAAVLAFNPRFLFTGMLFNYDSLTLLLSSLFLWLVIRIVRGYSSNWSFWSLGGLAGLALVTKYLAAPLLLVVIGVGWLKLRQESRETEEQRVTGMETQGRREKRQNSHRLRTTHYALRFTFTALLAYSLIISPWFAYLLINFNEVERYGPVLGLIAPVLRGDGSDRTVEQLFAWLSGGQAPPPAYVEPQSYSAWEIVRHLPLTFWGNPVVQPYPLTWFVIVMSLLTALAAVGLGLGWRSATRQGQRLLGWLVLYCCLPLPFMLIRLFGARDALEAVQGRHILFLAGPAFAVLFVWGMWGVGNWLLDINKWRGYELRVTNYELRITSYELPALILITLLLTGAYGQLIFMQRAYSPPLPVQTTAYSVSDRSGAGLRLPGGAELIDYCWKPAGQALLVELFWQGGSTWAPADYLTEVALVDAEGRTQSTWRAYQTQARYPTRAWEPGDVVRDEAWLPLVGVSPGDYNLHLRLLDQTEPVTDWQSLGTTTLTESIRPAGSPQLWHNGQPLTSPPLLHERQTLQLHNSQFTIHNSQLIDSTGQSHSPLAIDSPTAIFIIEPDWPSGAYALSTEPNRPLFTVADNGRNFQRPALTYSLEVNFDGKIKLLGYDLPSRRARPGDGLPVTLYWQGLGWFSEEFVIFTRLLDNQQVARGGYDRLARENYSTLLWAPGEIISDGFAVPIEPDAPHGVYWLNVGWYRPRAGQAESLPILSLETGQPTEATAVTIGPIKVGQPPPEVTVEPAQPQVKLAVPLGGAVKLLGYDAPGLSDSPAVVSSDTLDLTLYWTAVQPMDTAYAVFVHVRNRAGEIVTQGDGPPAQGLYPTNLWDSGETVKDQRQISLAELEPGDYELVVGMYDWASGVRLPVSGAPDQAIILGTFKIPAQ
jgi:hypothetical protein